MRSAPAARLPWRSVGHIGAGSGSTLPNRRPAPIATKALRRIAGIYPIEGEIRGNDAAARQQKTKPLTEALRVWLEKTLAQVASGSALAQTIRHALNRWDGLVRFLDDGRIEIDSNTVERAMRPIALSTKNALFTGSDEGAENWAMQSGSISDRSAHQARQQLAQ
jgi:hypothetical protein